MELTQINQSGSIGQSPTQSNSSRSALSSDFETFLKMLTTQMENQDPLNPIESADFAVQLATFSGVEQQVQTNELLRSLAEGFGANGISQLAGWVGMDARVSAPAYFNGSPVMLSPSVDPASDAANLIVKNEAGAIISREKLPLGSETLLWGGTDASGKPLPVGHYTFEVESLNQGTVTSTKPIEHYARIEEARLGSEGVEVVFAGGKSVLSNAVTALRSPLTSNQ